MLLALLTLFLAGFIAVYINFWLKTRNKMKMTENIPGPKPLPILGNALEFGFKTECIYDNMIRLMNEYGNLTRVWLGPHLIVLMSEPKYLEIMLSSNVHIDKMFIYDYLYPWLGDGLLTSTGQKWKAHRKLFTPTFHFKILEQFVEVFNNNDKILVDVLKKHAGGPEVDICPYITLCALDNICETSMGVPVNAQRDSDSEYVQAIRNIGDVIMQRGFNPFLQPNLLFSLTPQGRTQAKALEVLHGMTNSVIRTRKQEYLKNKKNVDKDTQDIGMKKRLAFLDLLIQAQQDGFNLTDEQIREEVDTFMFEGHDTTTSGITFCLWALAKHQDVQEKVFEELRSVVGDASRDVTFNDLQEMKYLEQVIKESQRVYPTVPLFGRILREELTLDGHVLPVGCNVTFVTHKAHRIPEHFPNPEKFDPDRFLPENCKGRHPYAYIPFSAGPRNCIGQKFAIMEMKAMISAVLRNYKISAPNPNEEPAIIAELVLKARDGIKLKFEHRSW